MTLIPHEISALAPPEVIPVWQWIEKHRVLNRRSSSETGPKRVTRTPALKIIYDWFEDPKIREVVIQKPAQIGLTDLVVDLILWIAANDPSPTALFLADQDTARKIMKFRIDPALREMGLITHQSAAKSQDVTKFEVNLRNGFYLAVAWGSSISQTASMAFKRVFCDEINKPGYDMEKAEGGALGRIRERMETFADSKFFLFSTPTLDSGRITKELSTCDSVYDFQVECPSCLAMQPFSFRNVIWTGGKKATREEIEKTARYKCAHCEALWTESQRKSLVSAGIPAARELGISPVKVGYQLHRLSSLFKGGAMPEMIMRWNSAQDDPAELQNVINSVFGEAYIPRISQKQEDAILSLNKCKSEHGRGVVPPETIAIVAAVDVQQAGFWYRLRAFRSDITSFGIEEGFVSTWEELDAIIFRHEINLAKVWRCMIDTGGGKEDGARISRTEETYEWIRANRGRGVQIHGCKGSSWSIPTKIKLGTPLEKTPSGKKIIGGLQIVQINTDAFKENLWWRIEKTCMDRNDQGAWFLHCETTDSIISQIAAEEKRRSKDGTVEWVQIRRDNHMLDLECLCLAAVDFEFKGGIRPQQIAAVRTAQREQEKPKTIPAPNPFKSGPSGFGANPFTRR